jgi:hypothetical protein
MRKYHVPFWRAVEGATSSLTLIIANIGASVSKLRGSESLSCSLGLLKDNCTEAECESPRTSVGG